MRGVGFDACSQCTTQFGYIFIGVCLCEGVQNYVDINIWTNSEQKINIYLFQMISSSTVASYFGTNSIKHNFV